MASDVFADRFRIDRVAGVGGMGTVFRATDLTSNAPVALKVVDVAAADLERFVLEAEVLARLEHPAIVRYVAHGQSAQGPFLAMEWLEGEDLATRLARGRLTVHEARVLTERLALALAHAHQRGIVHRDVKPSNVLLRDGKIEEATLVDFGIARLVAPDRARTRTGMVLGTIGYMAPEQARGDKRLGAGVDVFALGCVLFECVAGRPAFDGEHAVAVLAKILLEDPPRLDQLDASVPTSIAKLVESMLAKDPEERPRDGADLAARLVDVESRTIPAPPMSATHLSEDEQRLACVVLVASRRAESGVAPTVSSEAQRRAVDEDRRLVEAHGGRLEALADGSVIALLRGGVAAELARSAARCALALRERHRDAIVSVTTGRAVVAAVLPVGEAIDRAATLVGAFSKRGAPDAIAIDATTADLLGAAFDVRGDGGQLALMGVRAEIDTPRTLLGKTTACVGRERETAALLGIFDECVAEPGARVALLTGPAGCGKSRVRFELLRKLDTASVRPRTLIARADAMSSGALYTMLAGALRTTAKIDGSDPPEVKRRKLLARVARHVHADQVVRVTEVLGEIMGVHTPEPTSDELRAVREDGSKLPAVFSEAFADFLRAEASAGPVLLVVEDLHWAHATTVDAIDRALEACREHPLFVVGLARPEVHARHPELWNRHALTEIALTPLGTKASERVVRDVLGAQTPKAVVDELVALGGGNPLQLEELIRARAEGRADAPSGSLLAIIQSWLETLAPLERRVLRGASIFGEAFRAEGVAALLGDAAAVPALLASLEKREVVTRRGPDELAFRHDLVREASYLALTDVDRTTGHGLAAEWLRDQGESNTTVIAEHLARSGDVDRVLDWLKWWEDETMMARVAPFVGDVASRLLPFLSEHASPAQRALARTRLASVAVTSHQFDLASKFLETIDVSTAPRMRSRLQMVRAMSHGRVGDFASVLATLADVDVADLDADDVERVEIERIQALAAGRHADVRERLEALQRQTSARSLRRRVEIAKLAGLVSLFMGDDARSLACWEEHQALAKQVGLVYEVALSAHNLADTLLRLGELDRARVAARDAVDVAERHGFSRLLLHNLAFVAYLDAAVDPTASLVTMARIIEEASERGFAWDALSVRYWRAKLLVASSAPNAAAEVHSLIDEATKLNHRFLVEDAMKLLRSSDER